MRQLVELQKEANKFKSLNTEVIAIFREESKGTEGLDLVKQRTKTTFTLALDLNKKSSSAYSGKRMTFDNFVIDRQGIVRDIVPGTLRSRARAERLLKTLKSLENK